MYISESKLKNIINNSVSKILKESFNDNRIAIEIEEHGGLLKFRRKYGASQYANYDLQNCKYVGYLSSETINELDDTNLLWLLREHLLYTNDGGAIVVDKTNEKKEIHTQSPWEKKVSDRNNKWIEKTNNPHYTKDNAIVPNEINTMFRRSEMKKL